MKALALKDILLIGLLSVIWGVIYLGTGYVSSLMLPFLGPLAHEVVYGIWFVAAPMALYIIRKPGTALLTEVLAALIEVLLGSIYGPSVFIIGSLQGFASELGFAIFGYRNYKVPAFILSALFTSWFSYVWSFISNGYAAYSLSYNLTNIVVRSLSAVVFFYLSKKITDQLHASGVLRDYAIGQDEE